MNLEQVNEILPPGNTKDFKVIGKSLYTLDTDSGLTYLPICLTSESNPIRFPELKDYRWLFIDSSNFYFVSDKSGIAVFSRKDYLPGRMILHKMKLMRY
ncbi:MAG: hypothetical protein U5J96_13610 [Ignavibacteriaceae bacterium]|nr:hypothetical protein [Ignavibacteriaceae bacterium]